MLFVRLPSTRFFFHMLTFFPAIAGCLPAASHTTFHLRQPTPRSNVSPSCVNVNVLFFEPPFSHAQVDHVQLHLFFSSALSNCLRWATTKHHHSAKIILANYLMANWSDSSSNCKKLSMQSGDINFWARTFRAYRQALSVHISNRHATFFNFLFNFAPDRHGFKLPTWKRVMTMTVSKRHSKREQKSRWNVALYEISFMRMEPTQKSRQSWKSSR